MKPVFMFDVNNVIGSFHVKSTKKKFKFELKVSDFVEIEIRLKKI